MHRLKAILILMASGMLSAHAFASNVSELEHGPSGIALDYAQRLEHSTFKTFGLVAFRPSHKRKEKRAGKEMD